MAASVSRGAVLDTSAVTLSTLCILHCLALPIAAAFMPVFAAWVGGEWVHKALVLVALPISGLAMARSWSSPGGKRFSVLAVLGLLLLVAGAFIEALHDYETVLTVAGALVLASAHIWRWVQCRG